nr:hypothetical protein [Tanacetum cinerariifolium]
MIAVLEKYKHNVDFHQIVDFIEASHTRRNLKLNDEEGISSLPDAELFENLALMGYNILPNQKFTFQKGQFFHQWKFLIHTIIQCFSPKSTGFNEFSSNIATAVDLEISNLNAMIKFLEDKDRGGAEPSGEDATIKGRSLVLGDEACVVKSTKRGSNDTEELVNVLTSMDAANILTSGVQAVSVPPVTEISTVGVPTGSGLVPTVAREMEKEMAREDQRRNEQIARDDEIARIHTEEELKMMIDGLDRSNEVIARHLHEYEQAAADLTIGEKIDLINELKQIKDFVPMASKEEGERVKRKGLKLEQKSAIKMKTSEEVSEEDLKEMMQLVPVEEVYVEAL